MGCGVGAPNGWAIIYIKVAIRKSTTTRRETQSPVVVEAEIAVVVVASTAGLPSVPK